MNNDKNMRTADLNAVQAAAAATASATIAASEATAEAINASKDLRSSSSNISRENVRLHRLAPSVKHVKRPDATKPILEAWLSHRTLLTDKNRRNFWRLDENELTLYENDTSNRYFRAIGLSKITRVISASSLPKQIKEAVFLSLISGGLNAQGGAGGEAGVTAKSAGSSPSKASGEWKAPMDALFAFEVTTGDVYIVQANSESEANQWAKSLAKIVQDLQRGTREDKVAETASERSSATTAPEVRGSGPSEDTKSSVEEKPANEENASPVGQPARVQQNHVGEQIDQKLQQLHIQPNRPQQQPIETLAKTGNQRQHYHQHQSPSVLHRTRHKTYTDPNRSRLYNRPRITIKLSPMSIPDHWIEGKYLIERDRVKKVGFEELGSGQFGKVYAAISEIKAEDPSKGLWTGVPVAIKEISKARFDLQQQAKLKNEANILSRLDHPGVIILERVHDLPDKIYIVMEQLEDDMLEMIVSTEEKRLSERVTKFLTSQILEALKYLHRQNIAHCDLKPENVLLVERRSQFPQVKLCDFGFAKIIEENSFRSSLVGTPAYLAPEVVRGERYNRSVDLWSVGVIVYVSLSGEFPFNEGENIHDQISRANFMYPDQPWAKISQQAKNFINSLLRVNCERRLSPARALMDHWMQDYQLWCDLVELEARVGKNWITDEADFKRWSEYAKSNNLQVPRSAIQLYEESTDD